MDGRPTKNAPFFKSRGQADYLQMERNEWTRLDSEVQQFSLRSTCTDATTLDLTHINFFMCSSDVFEASSEMPESLWKVLQPQCFQGKLVIQTAYPLIEFEPCLWWSHSHVTSNRCRSLFIHFLGVKTRRGCLHTVMLKKLVNGQIICVYLTSVPVKFQVLKQ